MSYRFSLDATKVPLSELRQTPDSPDRRYSNAQLDAMSESEILREWTDWQAEDSEVLSQRISGSCPPLPPSWQSPYHRYSLGSYSESAPLPPLMAGALIAGRCIQYDVLSRPHCGYRGVARLGSLDALRGLRVPLLLHHDSSYVVDPEVVLQVDSHGLWFQSLGAYRHNPALFASVAEFMRSGSLSCVSVRLPPEGDCATVLHEDDGVLEYTHIPYLEEISLVRVPAWPCTRALCVASSHFALRPVSSLHAAVHSLIWS